MSDVITVDDEPVTRRSREDQVRPEVPAAIVEDSGPDQSAERMLEDSQRAIQERDRQLAEANQRAARAQSEAARARDEAARANMERAGDRATAVAAQIEAAQADQATATAALRAARDSGDVDAEVKAQELLASSLYRLNQSKGELAWLEQQGKQAPPQRQQPIYQPSIEAQRWLAEHPQFNTDPDYRAAAEGAHGAAIRAGHREGSAEYVQHIDQMMERLYGPGHGQGGQPMRRQEMDTPRRQDMTSSAGATNRGGSSGGTGGGRAVQTPFGPLYVNERSDGRINIQIPQSARLADGSERTRADWEEAATISGVPLAEYAWEYVKASREMAAGGNGGWIKGDGQVSR